MNPAKPPLFIDDWFTTPVGQRLLTAEIQAIDDILPSLFGYHLLQIGGMGHDKLLQNTRIRHRCVLNPRIAPHLSSYDCLYAPLDELPFASDSMDVVLIHHELEFAENPHNALREADRVLIPDGYLIIVGFNPLSLWGLWRMLSIRQPRYAPWNGHFINLLRLKDWLSLLGLQTQQQHTLFFAPPFNYQRLIRQTPLLERIGTRLAWQFGAVYVVVAKKRVIRLNLIHPRWHSKRALIPQVASPRRSSSLQRDRHNITTSETT